jgi:hypothetical protein
MTHLLSRRFALAIGVALLAVPPMGTASAQGCMPVRFVSPALGGRGDAYLEARSWRSSVAFRRLYSNMFFRGTRSHPEFAPKGQPILIHNNTVDFGLTYAVSDRVSVTLNVPYLDGFLSNFHLDSVRHETRASGIGDVNIHVSSWLFDLQNNPRGNVALGAGVKAPTGKMNSAGTQFLANGTSIEFPNVPAIQPGDGGWGLIFQSEAFRQVANRAFAYTSGMYTANLRESTGVPRFPTGPVIMTGVPDLYSLRAGASVHVLSRSELSPGSRTLVSASLGWREDGTTRRDLFGGSDLFYRAPARVGYVDNGVLAMKGRYAVSLSIPVRVYQNYRLSDSDIALGRPGGGGLARYLVLTEFSRRY